MHPTYTYKYKSTAFRFVFWNACNTELKFSLRENHEGENGDDGYIRPDNLFTFCNT